MHQKFILDESTQKKYWWDGAAKLLGRGYEIRASTSRQEETVRSESLRGEIQDEPEESQSTEIEDDAEVLKDFWSIQGDFIYRHHHEPRVQLCVPKEETFPVPRKEIYWSHQNNTHWFGRQTRVSDSWTGFTNFSLLKGKNSQGIYVVRDEIDKSSNDHTTSSCVTEVQMKIGKAAQNREEQ